MDAFELVRKLEGVMDALGKSYPQKTGFLAATLGGVMNEIQFRYPEAYVDVEKYIDKSISHLEHMT